MIPRYQQHPGDEEVHAVLDHSRRKELQQIVEEYNHTLLNCEARSYLSTDYFGYFSPTISRYRSAFSGWAVVEGIPAILITQCGMCS